jgi:hypothetical protein
MIKKWRRMLAPGFACERERGKWEGVKLFVATSKGMTMSMPVFTLYSENIDTRELVE